MNKTPRKNTKGKALAGDIKSPQTEGQKEPKNNIVTTKLIFIEEIRQRAETLTPCLKEILAFRPRPQWHR